MTTCRENPYLFKICQNYLAFYVKN